MRNGEVTVASSTVVGTAVREGRSNHSQIDINEISYAEVIPPVELIFEFFYGMDV